MTNAIFKDIEDLFVKGSILKTCLINRYDGNDLLDSAQARKGVS
jgi:hypothetical protein